MPLQVFISIRQFCKERLGVPRRQWYARSVAAAASTSPAAAAITGAQKEFNEAKQAYFNKVHAMNLKHPTMIDFGISNKQTLESAQANANGAIIGSKFVQLLDEAAGDANKALDQLFDALTK